MFDLGADTRFQTFDLVVDRIQPIIQIRVSPRFSIPRYLASA
jgi:hypothetical protein